MQSHRKSRISNFDTALQDVAINSNIIYASMVERQEDNH